MVIIKGINAETAARWISFYYFGITFGRFLSGFLTLRFSNRRMIRLGLLVLSLGVLILLLPLGNSTLPLLGGFFLIGLGCAPIYPSILHETPVNFGSENSQMIMGIQMASAYIGTTFMPPLFGMIASQISYSLFPYYLAVLLLLMIGMLELLHWRVDLAKAH